MKVSAIFAVAAGLTASLVSAQLENFPTCALGCAISSLPSTGCGQTDIACICGASAFLAGLTPCVQAQCTPQEFQTTIEAARQLCLSAGVTLSIPGPPSATSSASEAESTTASEEESTTASEEETTTLVTSVYPPPSVYPTKSTNSTITVAPSPYPSTSETPEPTETPTSSRAPAPSQTGNAASRNAIALGGLGAAVVAFAAALL